jgi:hypothetical protein
LALSVIAASEDKNGYGDGFCRRGIAAGGTFGRETGTMSNIPQST